MILERLRLSHWRGYPELDLPFRKGLNLILGDNGEGKTNLVEAIAYLSLARSWRTSDDRLLIQSGENEAGVYASLREGERRKTVGICLTKQAKKILLNDKPCRKLSELSSAVNVLVFAPEDVSLFLGGPGERRSCFDVALSKANPEYFALISSYSKLLRQRNLALKAERVDEDLLRVYDEQMASYEAPIILARRAYVDSLNSILPTLLSRLHGEKASCELVYLPFVKEGDGLLERVKAAHRQALEGDLLRRSTGAGVHREDIRFRYEGKDVAFYGSQGENRLASLCFKLAPYYLIEDEGKKPIVVLDDVTSELDQARVKNLLRLLKEFSQAFVTATRLEVDGASIYDVASHIATRRN